MIEEFFWGTMPKHLPSLEKPIKELEQEELLNLTKDNYE